MAAKAATPKTEDPRGLKRICTACGARFYDMNKRPIICPSCDAEFTGEIKVKTRRGRVATATEGQVEEKAAKAVANDDDTEEEGEIAAEEGVVSLEDAEDTKDTDDDEDDVPAADLDLDELTVDEDSDDDIEGDDLDGLEGDIEVSNKPTKDE